MPHLILIDGPAGVGKGTLASRLAEWFKYRHIDSGLSFRAVGIKHVETGLDPCEVAMNLSEDDLKRDDLRSGEASRAASKVASIPAVRDAINHGLRRIIANPPGTVMDGRAGAYEFPEARVKIYLTASDEARALRRYEQELRRGVQADLQQITDEMLIRDRQDRERSIAPMAPGPGAKVIDSTNFSPDRTFVTALAVCHALL